MSVLTNFTKGRYDMKKTDGERYRDAIDSGELTRYESFQMCGMFSKSKVVVSNEEVIFTFLDKSVCIFKPKKQVPCAYAHGDY